MKKNLFLVALIALLIFPLLGCGTEAKTEPTPVATPTPTPSKTVGPSDVLTAEELIVRAPELKRGDVIIVSGTIKGNGPFEEYMGGADGWEVNLEYSVKTHNGLAGISPGTKVVVQGKFFLYNNELKFVVLNGCSLVSRDP